jgi:hypothetical protein
MFWSYLISSVVSQRWEGDNKFQYLRIWKEAFIVCLRLVPDICVGSRDSSICIATGYGLDGQGWIPGRGRKSFSSPQCPDRLCDPPSLLPNGYQGLFPRKCGSRDVKSTIHLHLVSRSKIVELSLHSPRRLRGVVLNELRTRITLRFYLTFMWERKRRTRLDSL